MRAGAPAKDYYLLNGTGLVEVEGEEGRDTPESAPSPPEPPHGASGTSAPVQGAPPWEALTADTEMRDTNRNKKEAVHCSRSGPLPRLVTHI